MYEHRKTLEGVYQPHKVVEHRKVAAVLSVLLMGLGQLYNRQYGKGIMLLIFSSLGIYTAVTRLPHAVWGIVTLGEKERHLEKVGKIYKQVMGDHSIFLLVEGLITIFLLVVFVWMYFLNIKDAYRTGKAREEGGATNTFVQSMKYVAEYRFPQIAISIPMLGILFFTIMPIIFMILLAFTNYTINNQPPAHLIDWQGFKTFKDIFAIKSWSHTLSSVALWTFAWALLTTLTSFIGGFAVALVVQRKEVRLKSFWRTLFILPYAIPAFVSTLILKNIFNGQFGPINQYLKMLGLPVVPWLSDPTMAKVTLVIVNFWLSFPVMMLMIIGILATIPSDMYEAADMDGASGFQKLRMITYPAVMFSMAPLLVMQFVGNINNFNLIFLLTGGKPGNSDFRFAGHTDILITWIYKLTIDQGQYNFASVIGIFIFIILSFFAVWSIRNTKAFKEEEVK
ncbi:arabinogalactan oligomer/maltooligosaccharide transport system permease protein [Paenibacillus forsythiae]|uniref:Maltose/maltodextrin transport system permease protein n=1 Tax=Paenibacillus forsythiae TaxID=365616 RepID=A0ABU3HED2_9BACL|nr:sugar ABC transporter permease [Paenibacillus forsythiae]MDT3428402.1 arabinogalactan oligomer/maltooligosaccharide transport system permease protein [Paenibacillus forsythiae]